MLDIKDWTEALKAGLPPVKLPKYVFGTAGCYSFMEEKLRPILEYEDLKIGVFQVRMACVPCGSEGEGEVGHRRGNRGKYASVVVAHPLASPAQQERERCTGWSASCVGCTKCSIYVSPRLAS